MTATTALSAARETRVLRRGALVAVRASLVFLLLVVVVWPSLSNAADRPASPAQLQGLRDQIAGVQAQQQGGRADLDQANQDIANIQARIDQINAIDTLWGPAKDAAIKAYLLSQGLDPSNAPIAWAYMKIAEKTNLENKLNAAMGRRDAIDKHIADLDKQIAQLRATLSYWQNPIGTDLENERTRLRNLEGQRPTKDDEGQLQWDIDNTRRRIKELEDLERQFQQGGPGGTSATSGQSVQPQSSTYTAPSTGFGAPGGSGQSSASQGQQPGYGPGPHGIGSPQFPTHQEILQGVQGSIGGKPGGKPGGG